MRRIASQTAPRRRCRAPRARAAEMGALSSTTRRLELAVGRSETRLARGELIRLQAAGCEPLRGRASSRTSAARRADRCLECPDRSTIQFIRRMRLERPSIASRFADGCSRGMSESAPDRRENLGLCVAREPSPRSCSRVGRYRRTPVTSRRAVRFAGPRSGLRVRWLGSIRRSYRYAPRPRRVRVKEWGGIRAAGHSGRAPRARGPRRP